MLQKVKNLIRNPYKPRFDIKEEDVFLVSYPRSGNTWLRLMLAYYFAKKEVPFKDLNYYVTPFRTVNKKISENEIISNPRIFKSHYPLNKYFDNSKSIYIYRDGRDVAVSFFHYLKNKGSIEQETTFSDYLSYNFLSAKAPNKGWGNHIVSALARKGNDNVLFIKYEDLIADTYNNLEKIVSFIGWSVESERLEFAITKTSLDKLKSKESKEKMINPLNPKVKGFFRKGEKNNWVKFFSEEDINKFQVKFGDSLKLLGYL